MPYVIIEHDIMGSINRYIQAVLLTTGSMISIWFLICNLQPLQPALYAFTIVSIIGLFVAIKVFSSNLIVATKKYVLNVTKRKYFTAILLASIVIVGLLARLFFYIRFSYVPTSDPMTFYDSAVTLASGGGSQGNSYVAFQPYLSAYNNILGIAMRLIPNPWLATILLNTFFDILSSLAVYTLLKKLLKPGSQLPMVAFGVWMLSPFNIIFSAVSLPVIVVNFFVVLSILVSYFLMQQITSLKIKYALPLSIIFGLVLGLGNCFRPIFIVVILALSIVLACMFLTIHKSTKFLLLSISCMIFSVLIFVGIQGLNLAFVSNQTGLPAAKNPSGWSMYVGSTWETNGEWRPYHNDDMRTICANSIAQNNFDKCHAELRSTAIARYKNYGVPMSASLFIQKLYHQAEEQNYFYNAEHSIVGYTASRTYKLINVYTVLYLITLFILSAKFLYSLAKYTISNRAVNPILILIVLMMISWFFALMIVESAPRYSTIMYPLFIIFSVLMLDKKYPGKSATK